MIRNMFGSVKLGLAAVAMVLVFQNNALAGPPLICHRFEIGNAKSLPWEDSRNSPKSGYDTAKLAEDTQSLLAPDTPIIVRMETLRRAALYAHNDRQAANKLLERLTARARDAEANGRPDALAWFDLGYLVETYKQANWMFKKKSSQEWETIEKPNPAMGLDGYAWVLKAIRLRTNDPEMEFAAALMLAQQHQQKDRDAHLRKAVLGAAEGSLLARNLVSHYGSRGSTMAELRGRYGKNE